MAGHLAILIQEQTEQLNEIEVGVDSMTEKINKSQEDILKAIEQLKQARRKKVQMTIIITVAGIILTCLALGVGFYYMCIEPATKCWDALKT